MKKAIFFLLEDYADWESAYLSSRLNIHEEWSVETASLEQGTCKSIGGFETVINYSLETLTHHIDLFVLIGGNSWNIENDQLKNLISTYLDAGVTVGAICGAVDFLAKNGLLNDFKHTGNSQSLWKEYREYQNPENFITEQVVTDRNLITANGTASIEFSEHVLKALCIENTQKIEREHELLKIGYYNYCCKYGDPFV
ncbi:type 1 glutamine amidotransferase family protein [Xenorhabdus hominickii]|uniref:Glutamine amidotransferase n=1 Tax=Xenorhabdus hominickii TaxID=351679 RepID=A0A2G0QDP4_XENHO|nr:type 1 glutamine amidotransferase family protein [Xenorhabdus hominickii]AOM41437.1 glutamine amidotransferase [Xenorhabdus hominickii]PHM57357.1 glutamine amidotransferase [Xenorhabdus hominickii]